jgi:ADP-heptose:LPS heptosyltransferase
MFTYIVNNKYFAKISSWIVNYLIFFFRKLIPKVNNSRVLIIAIHKIGDTVFTIPAIKAAVELYGKNLTVLCSSNVKIILEKFFPENDIKHVDILNDFLLNKIAKPKVQRIVKDINPGTIFDITGNIKSATAIIKSRAKVISGFNEREHFTKLYTHFIEKRTVPKLRDLYLDPISIVHNSKLSLDENIFPVNLNPDGVILISPFAGWSAKEWGFTKFIELAVRLKSFYICKFVGRKEDFTSEQILNAQKSNVQITFCADIEMLMLEIEKCSLFISNDSGPLYIANMLGKPTFTIYGPTNPEYSLPDGRLNRYIQNIISCSPAKNSQCCLTNAGRNGCPYFRCMEELNIERVFTAVKNFITEEQFLH